MVCTSTRALALLGTSLLIAAACGKEEVASASASATATATESDSGAATDTTDAATTDGSESDSGVDAAPTWHQQIAPIVAESCSGCHRDSGIAPFSLTTYEESAPWAPLLADSVERGAMPPFLATDTPECQPRHGWIDDLRLSDEQAGLMRAWADAGAPEGDPATAAPLPQPPQLDLVDPDIRLTIPTPVTVSGKGDKFLCFSIDPGLDADAWVDGLQISAGNPKIVHHVLVYVDEDAQSADLIGPDGSYPCFGGPGVGNASLIGAWAPGMPAFNTPPDTAFRIPAGARIIMNMHYHPTGAEEVDESSAVELRYHPSIPANLALLALIGNAHNSGAGLLPGPGDSGSPQFKIPAGAVDHTESMSIRLDDIPDLRVWSAGTHLHYVGTDMVAGIRRAAPQPGEPESECFVHTPNWNFNWQRAYVYDAPLAEAPVVRAGDEIVMRCTYNNSMSNPYVVQALAEQGLGAPVDVYLGEETLDEMCLGIFGVAINLADLF